MEVQLSTLELILAAAEEEFLSKGYEAASLREIVRKAGVTTGALYGYFKNKHELFGALVDEEYHFVQQIFEEILDEFNALPVEQQTEHMQEYTEKGMRRMADYIYDHWNAFRLILCRSEGTDYCHLVEEMTEREVRATDDFSETSKEAGVSFRKVNVTLERMLTYSMFSNYFAMVRQDLPREETDQYISQLLEFYMAGWNGLWGPGTGNKVLN